MEKVDISSKTNNSVFSEHRWLQQLQHEFSKDLEDWLGIKVAVFDVPKLLRAIKPDAYVPQFFAVGPYHQLRVELRCMERYKIAAAKRAESTFKDMKFQELIKEFIKFESEIRAPYHRYLDFTEESLAWMMAIDSCFLLEFLQNYHNGEGTGIVPPPTNWISGIVKDVLMLENQIPLFLLRKNLEFKYSSNEIADNMLVTILERFIKEVTPFKATVNIGNLHNHAHVLELLYNVIVPKLEEQDDETEILIDNTDEQLNPEDTEEVKEAFDKISRMNIAPIRFIREKLISNPINSANSLLQKLANKVPILSFLTSIAGQFLSQTNISKDMQNMKISNIINSPLLEEITIPSVSKLVCNGVKFIPTEDGISGLEFDGQTGVFKLPVVILDANTDTILRNLVAYEASVITGPLVFARYTELMNGIIDTVADVKILRRSGIILNHMKSDKEVADLWNGMTRSLRLTRVPKIDQVISDVRSFNNQKLAARTNKLLKKYVFKSWKILTLLAAFFLLLMTGVQTFCSVYSCSRLVGSLSN